MRHAPAVCRCWPSAALGLAGWLLVLAPLAAQQFPRSEFPKTDFSKRLVAFSEIRSGGPPRDGIPAIDEPRFVTPEAAAEWLDPREPVAVVSLAGETRAYPLEILIWHEIVNDRVAGVPVTVTFCPLCNATLAFDRRLGGRVLDFGTTGRLRKSDLVMYDRQTESWWQQFTGRAIIGELAGSVLKQVPAAIVAFAELRAAHPEARVLSRETGYRRDYGRNPYRGYDTIEDRPFLFFDPIDPRLPAMERVLDVSLGGVSRLYPFRALEHEPVVNDIVGGVEVVVLSRPGTLSVLDTSVIGEARTVPSAAAYLRRLDGRVLTFEARGEALYDRQSGSRWNLLGTAVSGPLAGRRLEPAPGGVHFAFAWLAFHPDSEIRRLQSLP